MLILIGMLEFGLMFNHDLTLQYASREGARVGSALGCGANSNIPTCDYALPNCTPVPSPGCDEVDKYIVAAVQRVLEASGSPIQHVPDRPDHHLPGDQHGRRGRQQHGHLDVQQGQRADRQR